MVRWLVRTAGAETDRPNNDGCTPLLFACERGHMGVAQWLVREGGAKVTLWWICSFGICTYWVYTRDTNPFNDFVDNTTINNRQHSRGVSRCAVFVCEVRPPVVATKHRGTQKTPIHGA